jgi:membrane protein DedA with SNARE-associated domain
VLSALTDWVTKTVADHGAAAVFVLMLLESACIPVPSEVVMLYAGYLVSTGQLGLVTAVAAGVVGNLAGSLLAWWVGRAAGRGVLERSRFVSDRHLALADRWFERHGERAVLISRCLPVIRTFISLPAGVARMRPGRFALYTALGCIPWVLALTLAGEWAGSSWSRAHSGLELLDVAVVLAILATLFWLVGRRRRGGEAIEHDG